MTKSNSRPAEVLNVRPAGDAHQVITLDGGGQRYRREPCATCPWRVDMVGEFPPEAFVLAAPCGTSDLSAIDAPVWVMERLEHTFACHESGPERPATCAGYILRGDQAIGWRLALCFGAFDPAQVSDGGHLLHNSYREMAEANGVDADDPELRACR